MANTVGTTGGAGMWSRLDATPRVTCMYTTCAPPPLRTMSSPTSASQRACESGFSMRTARREFSRRCRCSAMRKVLPAKTGTTS